MSETHQWAVQIGAPPPPNCEEYLTQLECETNYCYWWSDGTCHGTPEAGEPNYLLIAGIGVTAVAIGAIILGGKKKK